MFRILILQSSHSLWDEPVNGAAIFLKSGAGKFPSLAGWQSAMGVIGSSVFCRPAATLQVGGMERRHSA
jgi:hypothetical protein